MSMKALEELRDRLCEELDEYSRELKSKPNELNMSVLEKIHKLSDTVKNFDKIIMLEGDDGYSQANGRNFRPDNYNGGNSYANRGKHYVRGHYSRDSGRDRMTEKLREMMDDADTEKQRSAIRRCIEQMEEG